MGGVFSILGTVGTVSHPWNHLLRGAALKVVVVELENTPMPEAPYQRVDKQLSSELTFAL